MLFTCGPAGIQTRYFDMPQDMRLRHLISSALDFASGVRKCACLMNDGFRRRLRCPPIRVGCFWSVLRFLGERSSLAILEIIGLPFILDSGIYTIQKYNMFEVPACYRTYYTYTFSSSYGAYEGTM